MRTPALGTLTIALLLSMTPKPYADEETPVTNNMRLYLCQEAERITDNALTQYKDLKSWKSDREERYRQFMDMMGLADLPPRENREPVKVHHVDTLEREGYKIEKIYYESLPQLYVPADLYIPTNVDGPVPGVLYVCGHSRTQKVRYQTHARRFAQLGFVTLIHETIQWGEVRGEHWGCYARGWFHWYSRGYTPGGTELINGIRGLDLLQERPEVDPNRLGVTGISGGGALSWYVAAADDRIDVAAPVCGTGTLESHIEDRTVDGHCDCMWWINSHQWDLSEVAALIAPRPLMIASANRDGLFTIESIRECHEDVERIYDLYGADDRLELVVTPGPHSYHEISRTKIFSWFLKHLCDRDVPPEEVGDIETREETLESEETLRIYVDGPPADDRTKTIQDSFIELAELPSISSADDLKSHREEVVDFLREKTFGAFPEKPCDLNVSIDFKSLNNQEAGTHHYSFTPESGWRLKFDWHWRNDPDKPAPVVLMLKSPRVVNRWAASSFLNGVPSSWGRAFLETRGVGETSWGPEIQWHLRRAAAWAGRTIASTRVYDVVRCLEALRGLQGVDGDKVALAADGEMAAVALYAALLDGNVKTVILGNPPATQNTPSEEDGTGPAIEMLNCLRVTDLPQVAGLLWPSELVFVGEVPKTYIWAKDLYTHLGKPGKVVRVSELGEWKKGG